MCQVSIASRSRATKHVTTCAATAEVLGSQVCGDFVDSAECFVGLAISLLLSILSIASPLKFWSCVSLSFIYC